MPVRIIGMIGVTPPSNDATLHVIEGGLLPNYLTQFARAHDEAGFDLALVGHTSSSAEGFLVALYAAAHTNRLGYLVAHRPGFVAPTLMAERHRELSELQDRITARRRRDMIGRTVDVLVDRKGVARSHREAPEIDGVVRVPADLAPGSFHRVVITDSEGPDLDGTPVAVPVGSRV